MTLPPNYNHFRSAWDSAASDQKTIENLTSRLTIEETRISSQEKSETSAFVLRDRRDRKNTQIKEKAKTEKRKIRGIIARTLEVKRKSRAAGIVKGKGISGRTAGYYQEMSVPTVRLRSAPVITTTPPSRETQ